MTTAPLSPECPPFSPGLYSTWDTSAFFSFDGLDIVGNDLPSGVAPGSSVWAPGKREMNTTHLLLVNVDPATNTFHTWDLGQIPERTNVFLAQRAGIAWMAAQNSIYRVDPLSGSMLTWTLPSSNPVDGLALLRDGSVAVVSYGDRTITRLDPVGDVLRVWRLPEGFTAFRAQPANEPDRLYFIMPKFGTASRFLARLDLAADEDNLTYWQRPGLNASIHPDSLARVWHEGVLNINIGRTNTLTNRQALFSTTKAFIEEPQPVDAARTGSLVGFLYGSGLDRGIGLLCPDETSEVDTDQTTLTMQMIMEEVVRPQYSETPLTRLTVGPAMFTSFPDDPPQWALYAAKQNAILSALGEHQGTLYAIMDFQMYSLLVPELLAGQPCGFSNTLG